VPISQRERVTVAAFPTRGAGPAALARHAHDITMPAIRRRHALDVIAAVR